MPVVFRENGLRYYFFSNEGDPSEPTHIHVRGRGGDAKVWIEPTIAIAYIAGFTRRDLSDILGAVKQNRELILRAWHDHLGD